MARVIVVGDGPAGLSAALFLAKNGQEVVVYGRDDTAMHYAELHNHLGIPQIDGTEFQTVARGQVAEQGAAIREEQVDQVVREGDAFVVHADGGEDRGDYLVIAGGKAAQRLAEQVGAERREGAVVVDDAYGTDVEGVYAVGRVARPNRSQAIISAGAGAVAALDILAREAGRNVTDWDTPSQEG
ncbi:MAG: FAD-dependent oxidoreductase [Actinomycetota bacterium]|nr:FAD-dependent oxidoreductase [Actinomycetota bacterium]